MEIKARQELMPFVPKVRTSLEAAIAERRELGLSVPENLRVEVCFYHDESASASVGLYEDLVPRLTVNVGPILLGKLKEPEHTKLCELIKFFDAVRPYLRFEEDIFAAIKNPMAAIRDIRQKIGDEEFARYEDMFDKIGKGARTYRRFTTNFSKHMRRYFREIVPSMIEGFEQVDLNILRHELDHADIVTSTLNRKYLDSVVGREEIHSGKSESATLENYAQSCHEHLEAMITALPVVEMRAMFFDFIPIGRFRESNLDEVGEKILNRFSKEYICDFYIERMAEDIIAPYWARGEMDRQTSNFLFRSIHTSAQSSKRFAYTFDPKKVNFTLAKRITEEIRDVQSRMYAVSREVIRALVRGYKEDPSLLCTGLSEGHREYVEWIESQLTLGEAGR
jgi:hypothetical protein